MKKIGAIIVGILLALLLLVVTASDVIENVNKKSINKNVKSTTKSNSYNNKVDNTNKQEIKPDIEPIQPTKPPTQEIKDSDKENVVDFEDVDIIHIDENIKDIDNTDIVIEKIVKKREYLEIDINTIPYSNETIEVECVVSEKNVFSNGQQLIYEIILKAKEPNSEINELNYYISYKSFNSFTLGELCILEVELFENNIISINNLKKISK